MKLMFPQVHRRQPSFLLTKLRDENFQLNGVCALLLQRLLTRGEALSPLWRNPRQALPRNSCLLLPWGGKASDVFREVFKFIIINRINRLHCFLVCGFYGPIVQKINTKKTYEQTNKSSCWSLGIFLFICLCLPFLTAKTFGKRTDMYTILITSQQKEDLTHQILIC